MTRKRIQHFHVLGFSRVTEYDGIVYHRSMEAVEVHQAEFQLLVLCRPMTLLVTSYCLTIT